MTTGGSIAGASAVMAVGTIVSRISGFARSALLAAALGASLHADIFNIANTVPNMAYILLAGGIFNAVLVPQLVRAMKADSDAGVAYTNRIITLAALFLGAVTLLLVVCAPLVMRLFLSREFYTPVMAEQLDSAVAFARLCLPQVFFYGMFVLVGQVLNARGVFGPMMWAPIANNVISVGVLVIYLFVFGPASGPETDLGFSAGQELLLGLGATVGIVAQFAILVPFLKATGFWYRPRYDFRGTGLGHTLRLASWTVASVLVSQVAYTVVVRLSSGGTLGGADGTGYSVYSQTYLIMIVPHSVVTVSLATAALPRLSALAADGRMSTFGRTLIRTMRSALAVVVPFAVLLPVLADDIANVLWGHGAVGDDYRNFVPSLVLFGPALIFFTCQFLILRGFFALEDTRTAFWLSAVVALSNIVLAVLLVNQVDAAGTSPALVVAFGGAYLIGTVAAWWVMQRRLGALDLAAMVRFCVRLGLVVAGSTLVAWGVSAALDSFGSVHWTAALVQGLIVGTVDLVVLLACARALRLTEITELVDAVVVRLQRLAAR
ncbi:MAG: murein biosynthesis integral membrane protein MurJ [Nocardioides sp.]